MNGNMIPRYRLLEALDNLSKERMIYVCAPAGYGKTVAVRQWLEHQGGRNVVMTLDEFDNDMTHFCVWLCSALRESQPENTVLGEIIAHPSFDSAPSQFASRALAALTHGESVRFVIDDLHFVYDEGVLNLLLNFLKQLPECFKIVLISRNELPPSFLDLLVKGHLARITAEQLLFSSEEILMLYKKNGIFVTSKQAEDIHRFTDGWAIGIGAVLLSGGDPDGESLKHLEEFIKAHVWLRWDEETREFMIKTSVVREFTSALSTVLTGIKDSEKLLDELVLQNAFITRERNGIYRYHRLFHACLTHMLEKHGEEYIQKLQSNAGYWYLNERDFYNAVEYFIKSKDKGGIIECFNFLDLSGRGFYIPEKLLPIIGTDIIPTLADIYPHIYTTLAWAAYNQGNALDFAHYADQYYSHIPEILQSDPRLAFYIVLTHLLDFRITLFDLMQSLDKFPFDTNPNHSSELYPELGIINQNMPMLHRGTRDFSECVAGDVEMNIVGVRAALGSLFRDEASLLAESVTAGLLYEQGHLSKAYSHALVANAKIQEHFAAETKFCAMAILVCILGDLEQPKQMEEALKRIGDMIEQDKAYYLSYNYNALSTRCRLVNGDMKVAHDWLLANKPPLMSNVDFYRLYGHFTSCGAYIAIGDYDSAIILLTKVLELVTTMNRPLDMMEAHVLLSIACWKKKNVLQTEAIMHLEHAVLLAYTYGYTQLFISMGTELSGMLLRIQRRAEQRASESSLPASFVKVLYFKAIEHSGKSLTSGLPMKVTSFTDKQKAVMRLLCEGKSYKEMYEALDIKRTTLRSHLSLIYMKLDVTNELDAIKKIKALGVFDEYQ